MLCKAGGPREEHRLPASLLWAKPGVVDNLYAMAESWVERLKRESREMDASLRELFGSAPAGDKDLRDKLEALARKPRFAAGIPRCTDCGARWNA